MPDEIDIRDAHAQPQGHFPHRTPLQREEVEDLEVLWVEDLPETIKGDLTQFLFPGGIPLRSKLWRVRVGDAFDQGVADLASPAIESWAGMGAGPAASRRAEGPRRRKASVMRQWARLSIQVLKEQTAGS